MWNIIMMKLSINYDISDKNSKEKYFVVFWNRNVCIAMSKQVFLSTWKVACDLGDYSKLTWYNVLNIALNIDVFYS